MDHTSKMPTKICRLNWTEQNTADFYLLKTDNWKIMSECNR